MHKVHVKEHPPSRGQRQRRSTYRNLYRLLGILQLFLLMALGAAAVLVHLFQSALLAPLDISRSGTEARGGLWGQHLLESTPGTCAGGCPDTTIQVARSAVGTFGETHSGQLWCLGTLVPTKGGEGKVEEFAGCRRNS